MRDFTKLSSEVKSYLLIYCKKGKYYLKLFVEKISVRSTSPLRRCEIKTVSAVVLIVRYI